MKKPVFVLLTLTALLVNSFLYAATVQGDEIKAGFSDISGHWAENSIRKMSESGIVHGVGDNKFMPDTAMKRCEFVSLLHKALGIQINYFRETDITEVYQDVKNEDWYAGSLYDLIATGIVDDKVCFRPNDFLAREEMAHYIVRAYEYKKGFAERDELTLQQFKDFDQIGELFRTDSGKAVKMKLMFGKGDGLFQPKATGSRAEVVVVVERLISAVNNSQY